MYITIQFKESQNVHSYTIQGAPKYTYLYNTRGPKMYITKQYKGSQNNSRDGFSGNKTKQQEAFLRIIFFRTTLKNNWFLFSRIRVKE